MDEVARRRRLERDLAQARRRAETAAEPGQRSAAEREGNRIARQLAALLEESQHLRSARAGQRELIAGVLTTEATQ